MVAVPLQHKAQNEKSNRALAILITLIIHGLILLFLIYYIIITPIPPYPTPAGGPELEVDFGNNVNGTGNVEENNIGNNANHENRTNTPVTTPVKANNPVVTNNVEPSATMNTSKKVTHAPQKTDTAKPQPQMSIELAGALNKFKNAKGGSGGNGNSGEPGNAGSPNGVSPGTSMGTGNGLGTGNGNGFTFNLSGRNCLTKPTLKYSNPEEGQIVVGITVDQNGNVIEAIPGEIGSTITDPSLYQLVQNAAMKVKFNKTSSDNPQQSGTVTFRFTIR